MRLWSVVEGAGRAPFDFCAIVVHNVMFGRLRKIGRRCLIKLAQRVIHAVCDEYRQSNPAQQVDSLQVVGSSATADYISDALSHLKTNDLSGYRLVRKYVKTVIGVEKPISHGFIAGIQFQEVQSNGVIHWQSNRYGARLVRTAVQTRMIDGFQMLPLMWANKQYMLPPLIRELQSMVRLNCHPAYIKTQIACIDKTARCVGLTSVERTKHKTNRIAA